MGCCRGFNARLLFLCGCALVEYAAHAVVLTLAPLVAAHFYPQTPFPRLGFYTALLAGAGFLGHALSCRLWVNVARSLQSSKGVVLWGLAVTGAGFFSLLLCQSLLAMALVRFATGLFSGVLPVALIEIDTICGNRQSRLAASTKYLGIGLGAAATFLLVALGNKLAQADPAADTGAFLYFYPLAFISVIAWIAAVVTLLGLRVQSRSSYLQLAGDDDADFVQQSRSALDESPAHATASARPLARVKNAFEETFRLHNRSATATKQILATPRPHFRTIRGILPHYLHGFTEDGHAVVWDLLGQIKVDRLHASGFTTADIRDHYRFFLAFAVEKLLLQPTQKIVYVVDLDGLTLTDADERVVEMVSAVIMDVQKEFPDKLKTLAVLNAPVWFSQVMAKLKPRIAAKKTVDKITFLRRESATQDLLALIGVDSLPKRYGGRNGVEIGKASQERALDELLKKTTGSLEETIEIVGSRNQSRVPRGRTGSVRANDDDGSDEEAFFDSLEYGLQDEFEDDDEISIVVHSQANTNATEAVSRATSTVMSPLRSKATGGSSAASSAAEKKVHNVEGANVLKLDHHSAASSTSDAEVTITREPHAVLILSFYFFWLLVQLSFDELFPLWVFKDDQTVSSTGTGTGHISSELHPVRAAVTANTLTLSGSLALMALSVLLVHLLFSTFSSNVMTPLATLRVGLLFQIPIIGCFPLIDLFKLDQLSFAWAIVVTVLVAKHLMGAIAMHGLLSLLDNSIAVDRRLAVHRATQVVGYSAMLLSSAVAPALFALLGYFAKGFPFNHSLLYFVQALGLVFLLLFSFAIPSRMNFPQLFAMGKR